MRRVTRAGPAVVGEQLRQVQNGPLVVGSSEWQAWLAAEGPDHHAFTFAAADGGLHRALREWRREQAYWYVKVRIGAAIKRFYLGRPVDLDGERLTAVAAAIAAARVLASGSGKGTEASEQPSAALDQCKLRC